MKQSELKEKAAKYLIARKDSPLVTAYCCGYRAALEHVQQQYKDDWGKAYIKKICSIEEE